MEQWPVFWSARVFVILYAAWLICAAVGPGEKTGRIGRTFWSVSGLVLVLHILIAFHLAHDWSHDDALRHAARRTVEVTGSEFAAGLYFNYVLLAIWTWLTMQMWRRPAGQVFPLPWPEKVLHGLVIFFVYNATAVFGPPFWKPTTLLVALLFFAVYALRRHRARSTK